MPEHGQVHCDAENARLRAEVDRLNGLLVRSMFAEKRADEKRAAAEEARDVAEALLLQLSTTHRCTPGEMRKSCKRYLQGREPKIISVLKFKLWAMTEHRDAAQKRILELEAEVARLGGVVAAAVQAEQAARERVRVLEIAIAGAIPPLERCGLLAVSDSLIAVLTPPTQEPITTIARSKA